MGATETKLDQIIDRYGSRLRKLGFDRVQAEDFTSAPGRGVSVAYWVQRILPATSGLDNTSCVLVFYTRVITDLITPQSGKIDPRLTRAVSTLYGNLIGGFTLDGLIRNVDVRGSAGAGMLESQAGFLNIDNKWYRMHTITVPMIVNDLWGEQA